ncbi:16331_t:CDS:10 [Cetraspora pellucida]|uniref:16331_t:CDS:1 n=1 Tax=Cetraspora pellucida TaxID=1433469 RepID=A0A9N9C4C8_9GLOM|nr:16331_t:CDS:10 [Cetraspora pellucida]
MASNVVVLLPNGKKQTVKTTPMMPLKQIVNVVCEKQGYKDSESYGLKINKKTLDLGLAIRFANLAPGAKLDFVKVSAPKVHKDVQIALQLDDGGRMIDKFLTTTSIWDILLHFEKKSDNGSLNLTRRTAPAPKKKGVSLKKLINKSSDVQFYLQPVCLILNQEYGTIVSLKSTTLQSAGITSGNAVLRLLFRQTELTLNDVLRDILESVKAPIEISSEIVSAKTVDEQPKVQTNAVPVLDEQPKVQADAVPILDEQPKVQTDAVPILDKQSKVPTDTVNTPDEQPKKQIDTMKTLDEQSNMQIDIVNTPDEQPKKLIDTVNTPDEQPKKLIDTMKTLDEQLNMQIDTVNTPDEQPKKQIDTMSTLDEQSNMQIDTVNTVDEQSEMQIDAQNDDSVTKIESISNISSSDIQMEETKLEHPVEEKELNEIQLIKDDVSETNKSSISSVTIDEGHFDRDIKVFNPPPENAVMSNTIDLPDSFYELTTAELRYLLAKQANKHKREENAGFKTSAIRAKEEKERERNFQLQIAFLSKEHVADLYEFVKSALRTPDRKFELYISPPKKTLSDKGLTLYQAGLAPASLVYCIWTDKLSGSDVDPYLSDEYLKLREDIPNITISESVSTSFVSDNLSVRINDVVRKHQNDSPKSHDRKEHVESSSSNKSKFPKWFKKPK